MLIHIANVLLLLAFSVKSVLWLRALNVAASFSFVGYFLTLEDPLWASVGWNILFTCVNVFRIYQAILERRPPVLSPEEQRLYRAVFSDLEPRAYRRLLDQGQWENGLPPEVLVSTGAVPERLWMIAEGAIELRRDDALVGRIEAGEFVGDACFFSTRAAPCEVVIAEPVRFISWPREQLRGFLEADPTLGAAVQRVLGRALVAKLEAA